MIQIHSNPLKKLHLNHPALGWDGVVDMEFGPGSPRGPYEPEWAMPWRIDRHRRRLFEPSLFKRSLDAAGVRLVLHSNTEVLAVGVDPCLDMEATEQGTHWTFDLYVDDVLHSRVRLPRERTELKLDGWEPGTHRLELYCDIVSPVRFTSVAVEADAEVLIHEDHRPRWLVYGSSITQCGGAAGPGETWPAIVGRRFQFHHINLGYGGNAVLDPESARMMAAMPADFISVCLSVNNHGCYTPRTWRPAVIGFIQSIRDGHPDTPMVCVSPITSPPRETEPSPSGLTLEFMREQVHDAVDALCELGDLNLHYVDGSVLFGPDAAQHLPDEVHPSAEGYRILAERYAELVIPLFEGVESRRDPVAIDA